MRGGIHQSKEKERLAIFHLPANPLAPPKGGTKLTPSTVPCIFTRKAKLGVSKSILSLKEEKNIFEE